jgi:hypothetical protein
MIRSSPRPGEPAIHGLGCGPGQGTARRAGTLSYMQNSESSAFLNASPGFFTGGFTELAPGRRSGSRAMSTSPGSNEALKLY